MEWYIVRLISVPRSFLVNDNCALLFVAKVRILRTEVEILLLLKAEVEKFLGYLEELIGII